MKLDSYTHQTSLLEYRIPRCGLRETIVVRPSSSASVLSDVEWDPFCLRPHIYVFSHWTFTSLLFSCCGCHNPLCVSDTIDLFLSLWQFHRSYTRSYHLWSVDGKRYWKRNRSFLLKAHHHTYIETSNPNLPCTNPNLNPIQKCARHYYCFRFQLYNLLQTPIPGMHFLLAAVII